MSGRSILIAIALSGWLVVSIVVIMTVAYAGFAGICVVGLLMWFICTIVDLEIDGAVGSGMSPAFLAQQLKVKVEGSREARAARFGEKLMAAQSVRFFKYLGAALTVIGVARSQQTQNVSLTCRPSTRALGIVVTALGCITYWMFGMTVYQGVSCAR